MIEPESAQPRDSSTPPESGGESGRGAPGLDSAASPLKPTPDLTPSAENSLAAGSASDSTPTEASASAVTSAAAHGPAPMAGADATPAAVNELPTAATPPLAEAPPPVTHPVIFHGQVEEYFRIWIVNTLLTLVTAGVFFSWAKVRKRRYLRGSTELMGHRFDYRANPVRLLIGHIAVLTLFLGYSVFGAVYPVVLYTVLTIGVVLLPWVVVRSLTFNAHNTVYRGIRFRFNSSLSAAARVYLFEPLLIVLTLGFYYPAWQHSKRAYTVENHRFGDAYFRFNAPKGRFYAAFFAGGAIVAAAVFVGGFLSAQLVRATGTDGTRILQLAPFFIVYGFGFHLAQSLIYAMTFNHVWNHTRVDEHAFRAELEVGRWVGLQLTNLLAIVGTLGLLYPWAVIRAQRYAASRLAFCPAGPIDTIQRLGGAGGSATGDMAAEFIGIDFGL
jgi:uncharacterized membrane protein YjgN (DUF898 family)